ncbi:hypothetical protein FHS92_001315 [Sphingobium subterraneum]|uniref:Uncharacterized protein n=1 Tax=Sphingobium subterraneum TaxID=627688 RepID=A0A841J4Z3_9SPHN|nr:hypothetical protein [Sphingobium subterraneum]
MGLVSASSCMCANKFVEPSIAANAHAVRRRRDHGGNLHSDAATFHQSIKPVSRCGHSVKFEPHGLWWHFERRGWDDGLVAARNRFWCHICRSQKRVKVRPL